MLLLLILIAKASSQDVASKTRFDKILQEFGFTGISDDLLTKTQQAETERSEPASPIVVSRPQERSRHNEIQSNVIPDDHTNETIGKPVGGSGALAALFSIAGRPKETKNNVKNDNIENSRKKTNNLKELSKDNTSLRLTNKVVPAKSGGKESKGFRRNKGRYIVKDRARQKIPKSASVNTSGVKKHLSTSNPPKQDITTQRVPIGTSETKISVSSNPTKQPVTKPVVDPVLAKLVAIANSDITKQPQISQTEYEDGNQISDEVIKQPKQPFHQLQHHQT